MILDHHPKLHQHGRVVDSGRDSSSRADDNDNGIAPPPPPAIAKRGGGTGGRDVLLQSPPPTTLSAVQPPASPPELTQSPRSPIDFDSNISSSSSSCKSCSSSSSRNRKKFDDHDADQKNQDKDELDEDLHVDDDEDDDVMDRGFETPVPVEPSKTSNNENEKTKSKTKLKSKKKKITFSKKLRVKEIRHLNDYSQEELDALFMTIEDYQLAKGVVRTTVRMMMTSPDMISDEDPEFCTRGLEFRTKVGSQIRSKNKMRCRVAVLNEQDIQDEEGFHDPELLSFASMSESRSVREEALQRGLQDEQCIQEYCWDVRQIKWSPKEITSYRLLPLPSISRRCAEQQEDVGAEQPRKQVKSILTHKRCTYYSQQQQ